MVITLKADPLNNAGAAAEIFLNQAVYANWPHYTEAKVMQIIDAEKLFDGSSEDGKVTENARDFNTLVESLNASWVL